MATTVNFISRRKGYDRSRKSIEDTYQCNVDAANDVDAAIAAVEAITNPTGYITDAVRASHINRNPHWFEVSATYVQNPSQSGGATDDPLDRPSILTASYEEWTEPYFKDRSATPKLLINSAGDRFDPLPLRKNGTLNLNIQKNYASFAAVTYDGLKYTTNASSVTIKGTIYAADTLLFLPPTVQEVYEQIGSTTHNYFTVTFRLAADTAEHAHEVEDRGYQQKITDGVITAIVPILNGAHEPVAAPWPLNSDGTAKAAGAEADALTFQPYASVNWGINFN